MQRHKERRFVFVNPRKTGLKQERNEVTHRNINKNRLLMSNKSGHFSVTYITLVSHVHSTCGLHHKLNYSNKFLSINFLWSTKDGLGKLNKQNSDCSERGTEWPQKEREYRKLLQKFLSFQKTFLYMVQALCYILGYNHWNHRYGPWAPNWEN